MTQPHYLAQHAAHWLKSACGKQTAEDSSIHSKGHEIDTGTPVKTTWARSQSAPSQRSPGGFLQHQNDSGFMNVEIQTALIYEIDNQYSINIYVYLLDSFTTNAVK